MNEYVGVSETSVGGQDTRLTPTLDTSPDTQQCSVSLSEDIKGCRQQGEVE